MWAPYSTPPSLAQLFHLRSSKLQHPAVSAVKSVLWKKSSLGRERPWIQVTKGARRGQGQTVDSPGQALTGHCACHFCPTPNTARFLTNCMTVAPQSSDTRLLGGSRRPPWAPLVLPRAEPCSSAPPRPLPLPHLAQPGPGLKCPLHGSRFSA